MSTRERIELSDLAKAIGDRQLELKFGQPIIYQCALDDLLAMTQVLLARVIAARQALGVSGDP